jgi:cellulose synthase/poly-beta-1,6-N-acetylglucosamine synthase-like glycosyltransferase
MNPDARRACSGAASYETRLRAFVLVVLAAFAALSVAPRASFWITVALLAYTSVGYPLLLCVISALRPTPDRPANFEPTVSVVIAAHNEEGSIEKTVRNTLKLDYPEDKLEVVVVSDGSTDRTEAILENVSGARVRCLRTSYHCGKTEAQNQAVNCCRGEIVVFSDATTIYDPNAIRHLVRHYNDPRVGAVSGRYEYLQPDLANPAVLGTAFFWRYENVLKMLQSRAGTLTGSSGCIYSVRRSLYVPLPPQSCSDMVEPLAVVRRGYRVVFERNALAYEKTCRALREEFRMRVRVAAHGIDSIMANTDLLNVFRHGWIAWQLISHKVLRWMTPLLLVNLLAMSVLLIGEPPFRVLLAAQVLFYSVSALLAASPRRGRWRVLGLPFQFCALHAAVLVGVSELMAGKVYTTWRPVRN